MAAPEENPAGCLQTVARQLAPWLDRSLVVAFSGGVDSTVLLHMLVALTRTRPGTLRAVHVNHGLSPYAGRWADHCQALCHQWQVPLAIETVTVGDSRGQGLEQAARAVRYQVFARQLSASEVLLQGHHQDDQAETLLFRLFRGTGVDGLAGIPGVRALGQGLLVRPLLAISRRQIEAYARHHGLNHIDDESNQDQRYSRNYLRQSLLPRLNQRWPGVSARLAALAEELSEVRPLLDQQISEHYRTVAVTRPQWLLGCQPLLELSRLAALATGLQGKVLRCWLRDLGLPLPGRDLLERIQTELVEARADGEPVLCWPGVEVRRYRDVLVASAPQLPLPLASPITWDIAAVDHIDHPAFGRLQLRAAEPTARVSLRRLKGEVTICWRRDIDPGMRLAVAGRCGRKTLKRWLQDYHVPPWLRARIPFVFYQGQMVAAPGLWVCADFLAEPGEGCQLIWQPAGTDDYGVCC